MSYQHEPSTIETWIDQLDERGPRCWACHERLYGRASRPPERGTWGRNWCGRAGCWFRIAYDVSVRDHRPMFLGVAVHRPRRLRERTFMKFVNSNNPTRRGEPSK